MIKVVSVETMRQIEAAADAAGLPYNQMMQNAGRAVAERALARLSNIASARVTVLVGKGNNGGDGLVAGRFIAQESKAQVRFYLLEARTDDDPNFKAVQEAGLFLAYAADDQRYRVLHNLVTSAHVVIDALFGIGFKPPFKGDAAKVVRAVQAAVADNEAPEEEHGRIIIPTQPEPTRQAARPYIIAVDCPSGLDNDTGEIDKNTIPAAETVTFIAAKPGLFAPDAVESVGDLVVATIGIPPETEGLKDAKHTLVDSDTIRALLPERPAGS
ncbi:MAG: hypothetical protein H7175_21375, partial [Burkholderiales bacterium]|nr:hypothetical protein [Anaerolineae bacterium]